MDKPESVEAPKDEKFVRSGDRWCDTELVDVESEEAKSSTLSQRLNSIVSQIESSECEKRRRDWMLWDLQLVSGEKIVDLSQALAVFKARAPNDGDNGQIFNKSYSVLGTIKNRICSFRARAQFLPNGGNGKSRRAARNMTALSDAWADAENYQDKAAQAFDDKLVLDAGVLKVYTENGTTKLDRIPAWEILVEETDGKKMNPECMYHVTSIPLESAAKLLKLQPNEIRSQASWGSSYNGATSQVVKVIEAWQRAGVSSTVGRHTIMIGETVYEDEDWEHDGIPLIIDRFDYAKTGMWGISAMSHIRNAQIELNEHQLTLRQAHRDACARLIQYPMQDDAPTQLTNDYTQVYAYGVNGPLKVDAPPAINNEAYKYLETIGGEFFDTLGVSQLAARGQSRPGVTAGVAIQEDTELQSDRLALMSQQWERLRVDVARWWWLITRDYARKHPDAKPKWRAITRGVWKEMVFGDIESEYMVRVLPSSLFGASLAGQFQRAQELIDGKWIEREDAMAVMNVPDLSPVIDLAMAEHYAMEKIVDDIMEEEKYTTPDPFIRPEKLFGYARARYLLAWVDETASDESMNLMRQLLNATKPKEPTPAPAPMVPPIPGAPMDPNMLPPPAMPPQPPAMPPMPPAAPGMPMPLPSIPPVPGEAPAIPPAMPAMVS